MRVIDVSSWDRRSHFEWFGQFANPCFALGKTMEVGKTLAFCRERGLSSFATIMYASCRVLNSIECFRYRLLGGKVVEVPYGNAAYTSAINERLFRNCRANSQLGLEDFCEQVRQLSDDRIQEEEKDDKDKGESFNNVAIVDDIYFSCVPWMDFDYVILPIPDMSDENKSIPRVTWGKYVREGERAHMTLDITANHALVDGRDMALAFEMLQELLDNPEKLL